jgi:hypothetical protein
MTVQIAQPERAQILKAALDKLWEAAYVLEELVDDPRVASCVRELEGCGFGWSPPDETEGGLLFDCLNDLFLEAGGELHTLAAIQTHGSGVSSQPEGIE